MGGSSTASSVVRWCPLFPVLVLAAALGLGCGGGGGSNDAGNPGGGNAGTDAGPDAGTDAGTNGGVDAGTDGGTEVLEPAPDPATVAPPLSRAVATPFAMANDFLFKGTPTVQTGVAPGTIDPARMAIIRGRVTDIDGQPLPGVKVTILGHPELGRTVSRLDGGFDLAVNGGDILTVTFGKPGYLSAQRNVPTRWETFASVPDVALVQLDPQATQVTLGAGSSQIARGSPVNDGDGARQATLLFKSGTQATVRLADGSEVPLSTMTVRATEYTVGAHGPNAMPADLPPATEYTYAVEFSVDEALAVKASAVVFDRPVYSYTDNFLHFGVGSVVPAGYYDPSRAAWIPSSNGIVLKVLAVSGGQASLDVDGSGNPASPSALSALGIGSDELTALGTLYGAGKTFWRVPVTHFSAWDFNWGFAPPNGSSASNQAPPKNTGPTDDDPCNHGGSIIECQNQVLGERLLILGTPYSLNYRSNRVPGRVPGMQIPLSGATLPAALKRIDLEIRVAGRTIEQSFPPTPNQSTLFVWDGIDAYGRTVQGQQPVTVRVGYTYDGVYLQPSEKPGVNYDALFGHFSYFGTPATGDRTRREVTLWQVSMSTIGGWDARGTGLGGWDLDVHHAYDPIGRALYLGNGDQRTTTPVDKAVTRFASIPALVGGTFGSDGSLYVVGDGSVRRLSPAGDLTTVAGFPPSSPTVTITPSGDEGPATQAGMTAGKVALGPDGSLYIKDESGGTIRRVTPDGIIHAFAGKPQLGLRAPSAGDGGRAVDATLWAADVAVGPDGSVYVSDNGTGNTGCLIRRVASDGIISTVAGNGVWGFGGDGGLATKAPLGLSCLIAVDKAGSLYILGTVAAGSSFSTRLLRVGTDGIIHHIGGNGDVGGGGDGGDARQASLQFATGLAVDDDGSVYLGVEVPTNRIRRIDPQGTINAVAGDTSLTGNCAARVPGAFALDFHLCGYVQPLIAPDGVLHVVEGGQFGRPDLLGAVWRMGRLLPGFSVTDTVLASADGTELYRFDGLGHHLSTVSALTKAELGHFTYDASGALLTVTDGSGNVTTIERDGAGRPTAIVGPFGQRTTLTEDVNGFLTSATDPAGRATTLQSSALGSLTQLTDPAGFVHTFTYDSVGRLTHDDAPWGSFSALARVDGATDQTVTLTTALNRTSSYLTLPTATGKRRTDTSAAGLVSIQDYAFDGNLTVTAPDGVVQSIVQTSDPRWFMEAPILSSLTVRNPSGIVRSATFGRSVTLNDPTDPTSLTKITDTTTVNSRKFTSLYDAASRTLTRTTPRSRTSTLTIDTLHRPTSFQLGTMEPTLTSYDAQGRIVSLQIGASAGARTFSFAYGPSGLLTQATDPAGGTTGYTYDAAGRVTAQVFQDGSTVAYQYDALDNLVALAPPGRPAHAFTYAQGTLVASYTPPGVGGTADAVFYAYDLDGELTRMTRADGRTVDFSYDSGGRLVTITDDLGVRTVTFGAGGHVATAAAPGGLLLSITYDGRLATSLQASGPVTGTVGFNYDADFRVAAISVNGTAVSFAYDTDGLLTQAGGLQVTRDGRGIVTATTLGSVTDASTVSSFGDLTGYTASYNTTALFTEQVTRDALGRVSEKVETIGGATHTWDYAYDAAGRLTAVSRDHVSFASYTYDTNGNRVGATIGGNSLVATYDARDRLIQSGTVSFAFDADGEEVSSTAGAQTTSYTIDALGELREVDISGGGQITYLIDARGRRVGKKLNGTLVQGFLYQDDLRPIAELDGSNAVVSRFVYATGRTVPDYMVKGGHTYRIIADHVGSPRLVVDTATGAVAERLDFDEFGRVLVDTAPGFQPFGFAGGLRDVDTGLVLLGARSYDPTTGRWMSRDPRLFGGDSANLYTYARNDPLNAIDPSGLLSFGLSAYAVVGAGAKFGVNSDGFSVCVEGGLGAGGSVELDPFGGLDPPGTVTKVEGELSVGAGLATAGFKATASLDSAGCGKAGVEARLGPITTDLGTGSTNVNPQLDIHGVPKFDVGAEAQVKAVAQHCWRASW